MNSHVYRLLATLAAAALASGCGEKETPHRHAHADAHGHAKNGDHAKPSHEHDHRHRHADGRDPAPDRHRSTAAASFRAGDGLRLAPKTSTALGVTFAAVTERRLTPMFAVTARVFEPGPSAKALALVPSTVADALEQHPPAEVTLLSVRRDRSSTAAPAELVLGLPGSPELGATIPLELRGAERTVLCLPRAAILASATGTFVYVKNGDALLRTAVKLGSSQGDRVEILAGLPAGAEVAAAAVEQLWLTELRLTKGGGHSH